MKPLRQSRINTAQNLMYRVTTLCLADSNGRRSVSTGISYLKFVLNEIKGVVSYVRMFIAAKNFCANVHRSESSYARKCIGAKVHTCKSAY